MQAHLEFLLGKIFYTSLYNAKFVSSFLLFLNFQQMFSTFEKKRKIISGGKVDRRGGEG